MFDSCLIHVTFLPSHLSSSFGSSFWPGSVESPCLLCHRPMGPYTGFKPYTGWWLLIVING